MPAPAATRAQAPGITTTSATYSDDGGLRRADPLVYAGTMSTITTKKVPLRSSGEHLPPSAGAKMPSACTLPLWFRPDELLTVVPEYYGFVVTAAPERLLPARPCSFARHAAPAASPFVVRRAIASPFIASRPACCACRNGVSPGTRRRPRRPHCSAPRGTSPPERRTDRDSPFSACVARSSLLNADFTVSRRPDIIIGLIWRVGCRGAVS